VVNRHEHVLSHLIRYGTVGTVRRALLRYPPHLNCRHCCTILWYSKFQITAKFLLLTSRLMFTVNISQE